MTHLFVAIFLLLGILATTASAEVPAPPKGFPSWCQSLLGEEPIYYAFQGEDRSNRLAFMLLRDAEGQAVFQDCLLRSHSIRRTPLAFKPPIGSDKGSIITRGKDGTWLAVATSQAIHLFHLSDLMQSGPLKAKLLGSLHVEKGFNPQSMELRMMDIKTGSGVISRLIVEYQEEGENSSTHYMYDGTGFVRFP